MCGARNGVFFVLFLTPMDMYIYTYRRRGRPGTELITPYLLQLGLNRVVCWWLTSYSVRNNHGEFTSASGNWLTTHTLLCGLYNGSLKYKTVWMLHNPPTFQHHLRGVHKLHVHCTCMYYVNKHCLLLRVSAPVEI